jgi:hypothetical protein
MTSKQMIKKIHRHYSSTFILSNAIVSNRYEHILNGLFVDKTPSSIRVYRFIFPLFDTSGNIHLTYSERIGSVNLFKGVINKKCDNEIFEQTFEIVREHESILSQFMSIDNFCAYLESAAGVLENGYGMFIYALANCLMGRYSVTEQYLNMALPKLHTTHVEVCKTAISLLDSAPSTLVEFILREENLFKELHLGQRKNKGAVI